MLEDEIDEPALKELRGQYTITIRCGRETFGYRRHFDRSMGKRNTEFTYTPDPLEGRTISVVVKMQCFGPLPAKRYNTAFYGLQPNGLPAFGGVVDYSSDKENSEPALERLLGQYTITARCGREKIGFRKHFDNVTGKRITKFAFTPDPLEDRTVSVVVKCNMTRLSAIK